MLLFLKQIESHPRSFAKAVSWRILGSIDTFVWSLVMTGSFKVAGSIARFEVMSKISSSTSTNGLGRREVGQAKARPPPAGDGALAPRVLPSISREGGPCEACVGGGRSPSFMRYPYCSREPPLPAPRAVPLPCKSRGRT